MPTSILIRRPTRRHPLDSARTALRLSTPAAGAALPTPVGARYSPKISRSARPFAGRDACIGTGDRRLHDVAAILSRGGQLGQRRLDLSPVALLPPDLQPGKLLGLGRSTARIPPSSPAVSGDGALSVNLLTPTTIDSPASIAASRRRCFDQPLFSSRLDRRHGAAHFIDPRQFASSLGANPPPWPRSLGTVENIPVFEQIGLIGDDLLHAQGPLLIPRARQAKRFVPGRQLHGPRPRILRQHHREHLEQNAVEVVFRLLLG